MRTIQITGNNQLSDAPCLEIDIKDTFEEMFAITEITKDIVQGLALTYLCQIMYLEPENDACFAKQDVDQGEFTFKIVEAA